MATGTHHGDASARTAPEERRLHARAAQRSSHRAPACRHRQLTPQGPLQKRQPEMSA